MVCPELAEWAGLERQRWVNRGGSPLGEEGNKRHMRFRSHPARCSLAVGIFIIRRQPCEDLKQQQAQNRKEKDPRG